MLKEDKFITTKYRVRTGVATVLKYLEWKELCKSEDEFDKHILDTIVKNSLNDLILGKVKFKKDKYKKRQDRSLTFSEETIHKISTRYKEFGCYKGELIEICIYMYVIKHLTPEELEMNGLDKWNIDIYTVD